MERDKIKKMVDARTVKIANYIVATDSSTRVTAKRFGVSYATVSRDMAHRLRGIDLELYLIVRDIMEEHLLNSRHTFGGTVNAFGDLGRPSSGGQIDISTSA